MDPARKKWLRNLVEHISNTFAFSLQDNVHLVNLDLESSDFLYKLLHLTGLVLGYPERSVFKPHPQSNEWNDTDKAKIFFTESLIACYLFHHQKEIAIPPTGDNISTLLADAVESIAVFYSQYKPTKARQHLVEIPKIFKSESSTIFKVEQIINHRLKPARIIDTDYWHASQYNIFIFLDIVFFSQWLIDADNILYKQESLIQEEIIKVIAVSIKYTSNKNKNADRNFLKFFLEHAIHRSKLKTLGKPGNKNLTIGTISLGDSWPGIINQVLFEYSIFTFMLDKIIDEKETGYINQIADYLGIDKQQKELCILAVTNFIYNNLKELPYLKSRHKLDIIGSNLSQRLQSIILKNRGKISREIGESKELAELLWKAKNTQLTAEEREKVKHQLTDIFLRSIPSLAIFMIPGGAILLPILLKILPEEILIPSSFRNK